MRARRAWQRRDPASAPVHDMLRPTAMLVGRPANRESARASTRSTTCSAASTGATTSSGSSTGRRVEPFYRAIAGQSGVFETKTVVSLGSAVNTYGVPGLAIIDAGPARPSPATCCARSTACASRAGRRLLLFESLDSMVRAWGATRHARVLRALLPAAARGRRDRLLVDERARHAGGGAGHRQRGRRSACCASTSAASAWSRPRAATTTSAARCCTGTSEAGRPVLAPPEIVGRVAASLRAVRRARNLSQHDLGDLAGVTASAISQVERAERGLSLATLVRLSAALGVTIDDLLRGEDPGATGSAAGPTIRSAGSSTRCTLLGDATRTCASTSCTSTRARPPSRRRSAAGHGDRRRRQRPRPGQGRGPDAGAPPRRGAGRRQRADRGLAQPRPGRGDAVLDRVRGIQAVTRPYMPSPRRPVSLSCSGWKRSGQLRS